MRPGVCASQWGRLGLCSEEVPRGLLVSLRESQTGKTRRRPRGCWQRVPSPFSRSREPLAGNRAAFSLRLLLPGRPKQRSGPQ